MLTSIKRSPDDKCETFLGSPAMLMIEKLITNGERSVSFFSAECIIRIFGQLSVVGSECVDGV